jgi:hypothetical protein
MHIIDSLMLLNDAGVDAEYAGKETFWIADEDQMEYGYENCVEVWRRSDVGIIYSQGSHYRHQFNMESLN